MRTPAGICRKNADEDGWKMKPANTERIMELAEFEEKHVRVTDTDGETHTGIAQSA